MQIQYGQIINPNMYQKICKPEHFMTKYQGFGISEYILDMLIQKDIKIIQIIYLGKTKTEVYITTTRQYINSNKKHTYKENDKQRFLSTKEMIPQ